jgi:hypothetical protein
METIYSYSRAQALDDAVLVDVTNDATEAGFRIPVALTAAAWVDCVKWTTEDNRRQTVQDQQGRLWDVLWMAHLAARAARGSSETLFSLYRVPRGGCGIKPRLVTLKLTIGPGDAGEPVATIMLPTED